jgi:hypothetical protein
MSGNIDLQLNYTISGNPPVVQSELQVQVIAGIMSVGGVALVCLPPGSSVVANYALSKPAPLSGTTHFVRYWLFRLPVDPMQFQASRAQRRQRLRFRLCLSACLVRI